MQDKNRIMKYTCIISFWPEGSSDQYGQNRQKKKKHHHLALNVLKLAGNKYYKYCQAWVARHKLQLWPDAEFIYLDIIGNPISLLDVLKERRLGLGRVGF